MDDVILGWMSIAVMAASVRLWIRAFKSVEIPENRSGFIAAWVIGAALGAVALMGEPGLLGGVPAAIGAGASAFFLLTVAIGKQKVAAGVIQVGAAIPRFSAIDEHGQTFNSESLAGHPVLIKFFRGHW